MLDKEIVQVTVTSSLCLILIILRATYRLSRPCRNPSHLRCHRRYHSDDFWMVAAIVPLIGRTAMIAWSNALLDRSVDVVGVDAEGRERARMLSAKLLLPSRVFYVLL